MLGRARDRGVAGVEIHVVGIGQVAADDRALEEMDMFQRIDGAGAVIEVLNGAVAVSAGVGVDDADRRARRAEMHLLAPGFQVEFRILAIQDEVAPRLGDHILDHGAGEPKAPVLAKDRATRDHQIDPRLGSVSKADLFQNIERRLMDPHHL